MHSDDLESSYDVIVVGGGAAGLNGALMLARSRRSVAVIDAGQPRNAPAEGVHGLLARDGMPPSELLDRGRSEVRSYGGSVVAGSVARVSRTATGFEVRLGDGRSTAARRLLITTGLVDELPDVAGLAERWGRDVIHCPYCHGWEVRDQAIGVLVTGPTATHQALLFRQLSDDVVVFTHRADRSRADRGGADRGGADRGGAELSEHDRLRMLARGIILVEGEVGGLRITDDQLTGVVLAGGRVVPRQVVTVQSRMVARGGFLADIGLKAVDHPMGIGSHIPADPTGLTSVPGVYVAGNVTDLAAQVGAAAAAGALAGARINADLAEEESETALAVSVPATHRSAGPLAAH